MFSHHTSLPKGTYAPAKPFDLRSPCPMINALANHGYLPRDGRNVHQSDLMDAMNMVGLSYGLSSFFVKPLFLERKDAKPFIHQPRAASFAAQLRSLLSCIIYVILNPWAIFFSALALRKPGQKDSKGVKILNLDQMATPGVIEHDVSLTRHDYAQGNNHSAQPDLVRNLLESSSDGCKTLSLDDFCALRKRRVQKQKAVNPHLTFGLPQHLFGCTEIGLVLNVLGDGSKVRHDYMRGFFEEEKLPFDLGWTGKRWFKVGFVTISYTTIKAMIKAM